MISILSGGLMAAGGFFFVAGTVGLLRFPDIYCRLHALTKADNLGLGLVVLGLVLREMPWTSRLQLALIWFLVLIAAATVCHLLARSSLERGVEPVTGHGIAGAGQGSDGSQNGSGGSNDGSGDSDPGGGP